MTLIDIIKKINSDFQIISNKSFNKIINITLSSDEANNQNIFAAVKGFKTDGHKYIDSAYQNGCRDFIVESLDLMKQQWQDDSTIVLTKDSRNAIADISNMINDFPSNKLKMIGITGTKGKTSVTSLIHYFLSSKYKTSMFSTIKNIVGGVTSDAVRTTMESNKLQTLLRKSYQSGEKYAVVEVSSHAVTLKRVEGIQWDIGVFTSFSRDHLALYGTMDKYFEAKLDFFRMLNSSSKKNKIAVINIDDPKGEKISSAIDDSVKIVRVGSRAKSDYYIKNFKINDNGIIINLKIKNKPFILKSPMKGEFNVMNIALATAAAIELGLDMVRIQKKLSTFDGVKGRFQIILQKPFTIIIDYAHTPDSLQKILYEAKKMSINRVISVFGCTGERDKDKRSIMGEIAAKMCDFSYITNDDTYQEDPQSIAFDVEKGFNKAGKKIDIDYKIILNRKSAIKKAIKEAKKGDVIVIAGMGHEKVQILANGPVEHNDEKFVLEVLG